MKMAEFTAEFFNISACTSTHKSQPFQSISLLISLLNVCELFLQLRTKSDALASLVMEVSLNNQILFVHEHERTLISQGSSVKDR